MLAAQELLRRRKGLGTQANRLQHASDGRAHQLIVVDDEHRGSICERHSCASALVGRVKKKLAPRGKLSEAHNRPPCDSTMERLIRSPIPVPCGLVVKNALKIWSVCWGGSPTPVSLIDTISCSLSARSELMASSRVPSTSFIASMLLRMRFIMTYCNCTLSPMSWGRSAAKSVRSAMEYRVASLRRRTISS